MTIYKEIQTYLERHSYARERRNKDEALVALLLDKYGDPVPTVKLKDFAQDFTSYDRIWRLVLSENPALQGTDYDDKKVLEQKKVLDLHYEMGYNEFVK